jgi:phosphatidylserine/phosphatidylglycerophosphate/cardiolipin synthase-like enzyme
MQLVDLLSLEQTLRNQELTTETLLGYCIYLESRGEIHWEQKIQQEFGMDPEVTQDVIGWLEYCDAVVRDGEGSANLDIEVCRELHARVEWLFREHDLEQLTRATIDNPDQVNLILNVPDETDFDIGSTIIGSLVDLLASASQSAIIMNPFYTQIGFDLLQEALLAVPRRGGTLTLVTRDVCQGTGENYDYVRQLTDNLRSIDREHQLNLYEFNKEQHETSTFHAKSIIVDRERAYLGSANMTEGSLRDAVEMGAVLSGESIPELAETVDEMLASDLFVPVEVKEIL